MRGPRRAHLQGATPQSFFSAAQTPSSQARPPQEACSSDLDHGAESLSHPDGHPDERETQVSRGSSRRKPFSGPNEAALSSAVRSHTLISHTSEKMTKCLPCISPRPAQRCRPASQHQSRGTGAPPCTVMPPRLLSGSCHTRGAQPHSEDTAASQGTSFPGPGLEEVPQSRGQGHKDRPRLEETKETGQVSNVRLDWTLGQKGHICRSEAAAGHLCQASSTSASGLRGVRE